MHLLHILELPCVYVDREKDEDSRFLHLFTAFNVALASRLFHAALFPLNSFLAACVLAFPLHTSLETLYFNFRGLWNLLRLRSVSASDVESCSANSTSRPNTASAISSISNQTCTLFSLLRIVSEMFCCFCGLKVHGSEGA